MKYSNNQSKEFLIRKGAGKATVFSVTLLLLVVGSLLFSVTRAEFLSTEETQSEQGMIPNETLAIYDRKEQYVFRYPSNWHIYEIPSMSYVRVENRDARTLGFLSNSENKQYFKIEVVTLPAQGLSLDEWVKRQNETSHPLPNVLERKEIRVTGHPAIYQLERFGAHVSPAIFVANEDLIYIINPSSNKPEFEGIISIFLDNFVFE